MANVWTTMEKGENGRFAESGFFLTEPEKWYRNFTVADPEEFVAHMYRFNTLPKRGISRDEYEQLCKEFNVVPVEEKDLAVYGTTYATTGTTTYLLHADPETRELVIANTLHSLRFRGMKKDEQV